MQTKQHATRKAILAVIKKHVQQKHLFLNYYAAKRVSACKSNIFGHTIKFMYITTTVQQLQALNNALAQYNVIAMQKVACIQKRNYVRIASYLQIFNK